MRLNGLGNFKKGHPLHLELAKVIYLIKDKYGQLVSERWLTLFGARQKKTFADKCTICMLKANHPATSYKYFGVENKVDDLLTNIHPTLHFAFAPVGPCKIRNQYNPYWA